MTSTPRRGPLGWLRSLFGGRPQSVAFEAMPVEVPEITAVHRASTVSFDTPAKGGGFDFQVEIRCDWCAEGRLDQETLSGAIDGYQATMSQRLTERVRDIARGYQPFHAEQAERHLNQELQEGECFENGLVTCSTTAFVQPPPQVLEQQRKAALELQEIEHRYAKSALQVRLLTEVAEQWRTFLAGGLVGERRDADSISWLTPWAVLLAEQPDKAATEVGEMFRGRQEQFRNFAKLLGRQVKEYEAQDLFEFVSANERQLGHAMRVFGLPTPGRQDPEEGPSGPLPRPQPIRD
ncbi:hypothetical protein [Streptomyces sp. PSAA01]|uniref:hypothetical protein n=1 Tax=Streptomyces sp. PSAA01 TaxID=2912762 RepID=UPI001F4345C6|nr:hypothetical protein [Streptomyces sp. PSAA01]MCG0288726.1 hypothetical protein [Streptomyces sp. PSAA01]